MVYSIVFVVSRRSFVTKRTILQFKLGLISVKIILSNCFIECDLLILVGARSSIINTLVSCEIAS